MFATFMGPTTWYLREVKKTHLLQAIILLGSVLARNLLVGVLTPVYIARLITNLQTPQRNNEAIVLVGIVAVAGMAEVISLGMKQTVNYGVRRSLIRRFSDLPGTYLPLARYQGSVTIALNDFFASWREIMSAIFTQIPILLIGFGGLIVLSFANGMVLMGSIAVFLALIAPFVMYETTRKVRPSVKKASAAERHELDMLSSIFENFDMSLLAPSLKKAVYTHGEVAFAERIKTSWHVRRRIAEIQLISIALVVSAVFMATYYFTVYHDTTKSALIVTVVLVLTGNLTLIYTTLDAFHNAQTRAEGWTDLLKQAIKKPAMPPAQLGQSGIYTRNATATFTIEGHDKPNVVRIPDMHIKDPGLICLSAASGRGKSTFFNMLIGYLADYDGSVTVGGYEASQFFENPRVALVRQELKKIDITIADVFRLDPNERDSRQWSLSQQVLKWVGYPEAIVEQSIKNLSGGERRRVLTAFGLYWAIMLDLDVIILDEPTNDLDIAHILTMREGLQEFTLVHKKYLIVATHNPLLHEVADQLLPW